MPRERWMDKLNELCIKCKYNFDTWCYGRSCDGCNMSDRDDMCICLSVHSANCPYFTPKE